MAPVFSSTKQAAAFAMLLLVLLILPLIVGRHLLPPREEAYSSLGWANGGWPYIQQQIFDEKQDIDIAFIGPSHLWYGIDDRYVQAKLSEQLGRPAVVRSFCWGVSGYDTIYFVAKDLLAHRKVRLMFFYDDTPEPTIPHGRATRLFRYGENAEDIQHLSRGYQLNYYFAAVVGMPRNLLDWVRPNLSSDLNRDNTFTFLSAKTENIVERLGSLGVREGFAQTEFDSHGPFDNFTPPRSAQAAIAVYPALNPQVFRFISESFPPLQLAFIQKLVALVHDHHTSLAMISIPTFADRRNASIIEGQFWNQLLPDLTIVGIPPAEMYDGLSDTDVKKLYFDAVHFNVNGQEAFTSSMTPGLLKVYAEKADH